jgi:acetyl-CoA carboxylase biotin carboxyl carrier protein
MKKRNQPSNSERSTSSVDLHEIERLLEFMEKHGLEECEYERSGLRLRLKKASTHPEGIIRMPAAAATSAPNLSSAVAASPGSSTPAALAAPDQVPAAAPQPQPDLHTIKSPIVGTFYATPSPGADNFVKVGDTIEVGQVLCIIEAMKLMNEIESDVAGQLVQILVENGQPVEYGEPLFAIEPARKK